MVLEKSRNLYIDFIKGITILNVILIHTTFFSGGFYVPETIRSLTLFLDVPVFFFLSGLMSKINLEKTIRRLIKLQISYMIFITIYFIINSIVTQNVVIMNLFYWYIHDYPDSKLGVMESCLWFIKCYFGVILSGAIVLKYFNLTGIKAICLILFFLIIVFTFYKYPEGNAGYITFYLFIYLTGYLIKNRNFKYYSIILGYILIFLMFYMFDSNIDLVKLQLNKFPPTFYYLLVSALSLFTIASLNNKINIRKKNIITYFGQNSLFLYFSQCISSALLYFILIPMMNLITSWYLLLPIMYFLNLFSAIILSFILQKADDSIKKLLYKIQKFQA